MSSMRSTDIYKCIYSKRRKSNADLPVALWNPKTTIGTMMEMSLKLTFPGSCAAMDTVLRASLLRPPVRDALLFPSLLARTLVLGEAKPLCLGGTELGEEARTSWPLGLGDLNHHSIILNQPLSLWNRLHSQGQNAYFKQRISWQKYKQLCRRLDFYGKFQRHGSKIIF